MYFAIGVVTPAIVHHIWRCCNPDTEGLYTGAVVYRLLAMRRGVVEGRPSGAGRAAASRRALLAVEKYRRELPGASCGAGLPGEARIALAGCPLYVGHTLV